MIRRTEHEKAAESKVEVPGDEHELVRLRVEVDVRVVPAGEETIEVDEQRRHGKVAQDYCIPESARHNTPARLQEILAPYQQNGQLPDYPFGTDLTEQELALSASLRKIKSLSEEPGQFIAATFKALLHKADPEAAKPFLERMQLEHPETTRDFLIQQLLLLELEERGVLKAS